MIAALQLTYDMKPAIAEEGRLIFANVTLIPRLLGPDLSIEKMKLSYTNRTELKPANTTNTYMVLNLQRVSCVYEATVAVTYELFNVLNYVENDEILERAASDAWKAKTMPNVLDRRGYVETMRNMISSEALTHMSRHLVSAIANRGDDLKSRIEYPPATEGSAAIKLDNHKPLAVCAECDLYTVRSLKQCSCKLGFYFCGKACQKKHWDKGHKLAHHQAIA